MRAVEALLNQDSPDCSRGDLERVYTGKLERPRSYKSL